MAKVEHDNKINYFRIMKYRIEAQKDNSRFIYIETEVDCGGRSEIFMQLSAWRPGRYEIGNFAKNIRAFKVKNSAGELLPFKKTNKDRWQISCSGSEILIISYEYYAASLDAGSTYCGIDLIYMNPVNCILYDEERMNLPCQLSLKIPNDWEIACALPKEGKTLFAKNYEHLADSPFIASSSLEHHSFSEGGCLFHVWFKGNHALDVPLFIEQAKKYTQEQIEVFGDIESEEYHYLFHFLPTRVHHGVEHCDSTVIVMGPGEEFNLESRHHEFLAISSHELFHYWNVKRIRPVEMFPYDYTKENYSELGYVYEGVTTYYGDYILLRSGVFNFDEYLNQFNSDLQKHFDNEGRYNYSVAESSWDTWLDGYTPGVPGRKTSIYTEGMLAAMMLDMEIRYATMNEKSLDNVMRILYQEYYKKGKAYGRADYKKVVEDLAGKNFDFFFRDFYEGTGQVEKYIGDTLWTIGCELIEERSEFQHEALYGFKISQVSKVQVQLVISDSPAEIAGLNIADEILLVNNTPVTGGTDWNDVFSGGGSLLVWNNIEGSKSIELEPNGQEYLKRYRVRKMKEANEEQRSFFKAWSKQAF